MSDWSSRSPSGGTELKAVSMRSACAADADGDVVVANPCLAEDVERRDEPVGGGEPQQAVTQAIGPPADLDAAIVDDVDPAGERGRVDGAAKPEVWNQLDSADAVVDQDRIGDGKTDLEGRARQPGRQRGLARAAGRRRRASSRAAGCASPARCTGWR